jgi:hypothetical protein
MERLGIDSSGIKTGLARLSGLDSTFPACSPATTWRIAAYTFERCEIDCYRA